METQVIDLSNYIEVLKRNQSSLKNRKAEKQNRIGELVNKLGKLSSSGSKQNKAYLVKSPREKENF